MSKKVFLFPFLIAAADQIIKSYVRQYPQGHVFGYVGSIVEITHSTNSGAAFSLLAGNTQVVTLLSALLLATVCVCFTRMIKPSRWTAIALATLLGGGIGNLIDRCFFSGVTDYIRLLWFDFPIFNLADVFITASVFALIILLLTGHLEENTGESS